MRLSNFILSIILLVTLLPISIIAQSNANKNYVINYDKGKLKKHTTTSNAKNQKESDSSSKYNHLMQKKPSGDVTARHSSRKAKAHSNMADKHYSTSSEKKTTRGNIPTYVPSPILYLDDDNKSTTIYDEMGANTSNPILEDKLEDENKTQDVAHKIDKLVDTVYYDKNWKGVQTKEFASYYRVYTPIVDDGYQHTLRDYYITGELQGESNYITFDKFDDSNTVFDGECISYFKNGSISSRTHFKNGILNGLSTSFTQEGLCVQIEYLDGNPVNDYAVVTNDKGLYSKVNLKNKQPIYVSPELNQLRHKYVDGTAWQYYINDGLCVYVTCAEVSDYGKYYRMSVKIVNNSLFPITFDPITSKAELIENLEKEKKRFLEIQSAEQYDKRIRRTQRWEEALSAIAGGLAAAGAGYSTSTTTTTYSGNGYSSGSAYAYGSGGYAFGSYSGTSSYYGSSTSTTTSYDPVAAYQAQIAASQQLACFTESNLQVRQSRNEGYLKKTTIDPGESITGYFNIKKKGGEKLLVTLDICGSEYVFPWDVKH